MLRIRQSVSLRVGQQQVPAEIISFEGFASGKEHVAMQFKRPERDTATTLVRVHSECLTGDVFHSSRCDCGEQLDEAISLLDKSGGVLLYMRQEGRGIGLYNKLDAYVLQDQGLDTYAANVELGFGQDERNFSEAAEMLKALELDRITLLTNNPEKIIQLEQHGITVTAVSNTSVHHKPGNISYLEAKKSIGQHQLMMNPLDYKSCQTC